MKKFITTLFTLIFYVCLVNSYISVAVCLTGIVFSAFAMFGLIEFYNFDLLITLSFPVLAVLTVSLGGLVFTCDKME